MKRKFQTKAGIEIREPTAQELSALVEMGDISAKKEILKEDVNKALSLEDLKAALIKYLD